MRIYKKQFYHIVKRPRGDRGRFTKNVIGYFFWTPILNRMSSLLFSFSEA